MRSLLEVVGLVRAFFRIPVSNPPEIRATSEKGVENKMFR